MSKKDVMKILMQIKKLSTTDFEAAHSMEDQLYFDVLTAIADNDCESPSLLASVALRSQKIEFIRVCA
jgi:hypothetical protein